MKTIDGMKNIVSHAGMEKNYYTYPRHFLHYVYQEERMKPKKLENCNDKFCLVRLYELYSAYFPKQSSTEGKILLLSWYVNQLVNQSETSGLPSDITTMVFWATI